jgi:hypothetical protein
VTNCLFLKTDLTVNIDTSPADAGFVGRMKEVNYDLDAWLEKELGAKLRPSGLDGGLEYLGERRGLWSLLKQIFQVRAVSYWMQLINFLNCTHSQLVITFKPNPIMRISSSKALEKLRKIQGLRKGDIEWNESDIAEIAREEAYFETVLESSESCFVNIGLENMPRPLHFLASFRKGIPMGLMLAEASEVENDGSMNSREWDQWRRATERALPGEVYVKGWDVRSQAGQLGIFEIGDRLRGIGELPFVNGGFEQAINLVRVRFAWHGLCLFTSVGVFIFIFSYVKINRQPKSGSLKLHFDRIPSPKVSTTNSDQLDENISRGIKVGGQGAWKSGGRRGNQEDTFGESK